MDSNPSPIREGHIDEPASIPRWAAVVIPLAAGMILGMTFFI
jgi:hypothetical protein